jgi:hypothetical protein
LIDLRQQDAAALRALIAAGRQGARLADVGCSTAIMLSLLGLAQITAEQPQRVVVTQRGEAFSRRTVL